MGVMGGGSTDMGDDDNDTREGVARMRWLRQLVWRLNLPETKLIMEFIFIFTSHEGQKKEKSKTKTRLHVGKTLTKKDVPGAESLKL